MRLDILAGMSPPFARLLPYLLRYQRAFVLGLSCVVITTAIQLLSPWVLKNAIDDLNTGVTRGKLALYAGLLLAIAIVGGIFRFLMRRILIGASRDIEYDLRNAFFARLQLMPLSYYQARRTGDLMSRATNDLNAVRTMIGPAIMYSSNTVIVFIVAIILMASIDGRLTLIALLPLPLVSVSVRSSAARFIRGSRPSRRSSPTSVLSSRNRCQACASSGPTIRSHTNWRGFAPPTTSTSGGTACSSASRACSIRA